jgi:SAM-dependent methyltransferase
MYDKKFYQTIRQGIQNSAAAVVPVVIESLGQAPRRVIDIGCGEGWWAVEFAKHGSEVIGLDGNYVKSALGDRYIASDLMTAPIPARLFGQFDLAVCLEVAEHLHPNRAASFITELTSLAPVVLFSAAIPGQGGTGHVNEQWPGYWVKLFAENEFKVTGALRWKIWNDERVENWYRQNLLLAVSEHEDLSLANLFEEPLATPFPVVHPILYDARRS